MKYYDVNTQPVPGLRGQRREVSEDTPQPKHPLVRMTEDEFQTWLAAQPPIEPPPAADPEPQLEPPTIEQKVAALEADLAATKQQLLAVETKEQQLRTEVETLKISKG